MNFTRFTAGVALVTGYSACFGQLVNIHTETGRINFVTAGASTRQWAGHQTDPFNLAVAGIPEGATVTKAFVNWSYLTDNASSAAEGIIGIDNLPVVGAEAGRSEPDLAWNRQYTVSYTADVTNIITGNGTYKIQDAVDEPGPGESAIGEGLSLLVIYTSPEEELRKVGVYSGLWTTMADSDPIEITGVKRTSRDLRLFTNALDGQKEFTDDFVVNGEIASQLGPGEAGNAWQGALGPGPLGENYYDHFDADIGGYVLPDDDSFTMESYGHVNHHPLYDDAIGHTFAAYSVTPVPEPASLLGLSVGVSLLARRRRVRI